MAVLLVNEHLPWDIEEEEADRCESMFVVEGCEYSTCKSIAIEWTITSRKSDMRWALMFVFWLLIYSLNNCFF